MKKTIFIALFLGLISQVFAQSHGINYQAVVIDLKKATGMGGQDNYLPNKELIIRFTILNANNGIDYQEEQMVTTDNFGVLNAVIGKGVPTQGSPVSTRETFYDAGPSTTETKRTFKEISWDGTPKTLNVELCVDKYYRSFYAFDTQNLEFVPYAYHRNITAVGTMDIEGRTNLNNELNVRRGHSTRLSGTLTTDGETTLNDKLTVNANSLFKDRVVIDATLASDYTNADAYPLKIEGSDNGIAIKINGSRSGNNSYVTFFDNEGVQGRIAGQTYTEATQDPEFIYTNVMFAAQGVAQAVKLGIAIAATPIGAVDLAMEIVSSAVLVAEIAAYNVFALKDVGVTYSSGSGDYAEWLPRMYVNEELAYGHIVGVYGGKVTKKIENAEQILVVSKSPIVLGNTPEKGENEADGNKIGFMGQVPVWVKGQVNEGDYIIASEAGNGIGLAVSPENLTLEQSSLIVGKAWQTSANSDKKLVNTVIGLKSNEWIAFIKKHQAQIDELENQVEDLNEQITTSDEVLMEILPAYKEALNNQTDQNNSPTILTNEKEEKKSKTSKRKRLVKKAA